MKTRASSALLAVLLLCTSGMAAANDAETRKRAEEWYERDKAICAEDKNAERRMQCMRDARAVYEKSIAGTAAPAPATRPPAKQAAPACANCGTVSAIRETEKKGEGTGLGAIGGAVVGGVIGNQFGGGSGKKILTVAGAAGGAYAGHQVEKSARSTKVWNVTIRMDDGADRSIALGAAPALAVGDRVRVEGNNIIRQ
ncbi:MAG TPA: glycine zipper 2TM domain-containing protein [Burkholderiales bacterium]|nr:glycine zipper 2TM domain-containing protein [Burkholderiales bacterium]